MNKELDSMAAHETDRQNSEVITLAPNGLGFGKGLISVEARIANENLHRKELEQARNILRDDTEVFTEVDPDAQDDGCGDGRFVVRIYRRDESNQEIIYGKSRRRAKIFGGGLAASSSMIRSVAGPVHHGETVLGDRKFMAEKLKELGIEHGAHTDNHAKGENCGCGAIDRYPEITNNANLYREHITKTLQALYGESFAASETAINSVFETYEQLVTDEQYFSNAAGRQTMDLIENDGAIIKELGDEHLEGIVVLNDNEGTTFDQRKFDEKCRAAGIESEIQVFVVDVWRGRMYADAVAKIALENNMATDYEEARKVAYADFMIRTLAVAGTLTGGDLPVEARMADGRTDFSLAA